MSKPNLILVITDDQGYPDLGCTGNPWLKTPNIDKFATGAVMCDDFHVSPLCTPSRGCLMTGRRPIRNGAWATCWGRSILRQDEVTMADVFSDGGYRTGLFGKWHLGDSYPYRPQDRGFGKVVAHKGGGVGQTPDFWGNSYFDDTYFHNGEAVQHAGYCTDVWFDEAMAFIKECGEQSFFCCIATNAPHSPYLVDERYAAPYRGNPDILSPEFYGMVANIDENFGRLRSILQMLGIEEETILVFMTDNGTSGGFEPETGLGFSAGMRGRKGSLYDGGHRVPFFVRCPQLGIAERRVGELLDHVDMLPTFAELCGLSLPDGVELDGMSVAPLLRGEKQRIPDRVHFVQNRQGTEPPEKWNNAVMTRRWRLINGQELYDIKADPGQERNIAAERPDAVKELREAHEEWWAKIEPTLSEHCPHVLGNDAENPTRLNAMDVMGDVAWDQHHILSAKQSTGRWKVEVERPGRYRFTLRRWPEELGVALDAAPPEDPDDAWRRLRVYGAESVAIHPSQAWLSIGGRTVTKEFIAGDDGVAFDLDLDAHSGTLEAWFALGNGTEQGAYYVCAERVG